ncbi:MAG: hypothetical protein H3C35_10755 [Bacteroidetes bacterium]|nr:hypothetical protein [Bacteroidota bacterium]
MKGVEETSRQTIVLVEEIKKLMMEYKNTIRTDLKKIYSQDLLNNLFKHPYTKIEFVMDDLGVSRITATKYLTMLVEHKLLEREKIGTTYFFINRRLYDLFSRKMP